MDLKKAFSFEHMFSSLSFKRRVLSGFGVGVLVSILLFSLFSFNFPTSSSSSALSWFFSTPNAITHSDTQNSSSTTIFNDLGMASGTNVTVEANNSSTTLNPEPALEKAQVENSSKSVLDKNSTLEVKNSSSLVHQEPILNKTSVREVQIIIENNAHLENSSEDDGMQKVMEKKDNVQVNVSSVTNDRTVNFNNAAEKVNNKCNIFDGKWVRDDRKGFYPGGSCPYIDNDFNCYKNGRPDEDFLSWRWQPNDCNIPRMNATDFLTRLKDKRLLFVGDSLNRNMWESLVCILRHSVKIKKNVFEASGRHEFKTRGYYSIRFKDYNCSVDFVQSPFLVREINFKNANGSDDERLRLDLLDETTMAYRTADVIVFNTGHWWTHEKTSRGIDYYQEGDHVYPVLKVLEAYKKALTTWARWVDKNINPSRTEVIFRGYSLTHFKGGQWNSGGQCHKETEPIFNDQFISNHPSKMRALERILETMKTPVIYLNISRLTDYRKDGHPSIYRKIYKTVEEQVAAETSQDCSHWCLPGIPDTWNELLYASLLINGRGSWKR